MALIGQEVSQEPTIEIRDEVAPGKAFDVAGLDAAAFQFGVRLLDVGDDELETLDGAGRSLGDALADGDRAAGAARGELHEAQVVIDLVVVVEVEADLIDVEGSGAIDVGDGDGDEFEFPLDFGGHSRSVWGVQVS